jgi:hypothetical protein
VASPTYWVDLFTVTTWQEFLKAGGDVTGFRPTGERLVRSIRPGDILLCYLVIVQRFVGLLEVVSDAFTDDTPIWTDDTFPCRLKVKPLLTLTPENAVPIHELRDQLSIFRNRDKPRAWGAPCASVADEMADGRRRGGNTSPA